MAKLVKELQRLSVKYLFMPADERVSWADLCDFLECEPPVGAYPLISDRTRRRLGMREDWDRRDRAKSKRLKFDSSPWVIDRLGEWQGVPTAKAHACCADVQERQGNTDGKAGSCEASIGRVAKTHSPVIWYYFDLIIFILKTTIAEY